MRDVSLNYCFQTAFIPVPLCREGGGLGSISFCTFREGGGMAELRWAGTLLSKDHPLAGIHICPCPYQEETEMCSFQLHQQLDRWYCHGHIHCTCSQVLSSMVTHLALRPLSLSRPTMNTILYWPSQWWMYSRSRQRTQIGAVQCGSLDQVA